MTKSFSLEEYQKMTASHVIMQQNEEKTRINRLVSNQLKQTNIRLNVIFKPNYTNTRDSCVFLEVILFDLENYPVKTMTFELGKHLISTINRCPVNDGKHFIEELEQIVKIAKEILVTKLIT